VAVDPFPFLHGQQTRPLVLGEDELAHNLRDRLKKLSTQALNALKKQKLPEKACTLTMNFYELCYQFKYTITSTQEY
jgi:hypothetical protein